MDTRLQDFSCHPAQSPDQLLPASPIASLWSISNWGVVFLQWPRHTTTSPYTVGPSWLHSLAISSSPISASIYQDPLSTAQASQADLCTFIWYGAPVCRIVHGQLDGLPQDQLHAPLRGAQSSQEGPQLHLPRLALPAKLCRSDGALRDGDNPAKGDGVAPDGQLVPGPFAASPATTCPTLRYFWHQGRIVSMSPHPANYNWPTISSSLIWPSRWIMSSSTMNGI